MEKNRNPITNDCSMSNIRPAILDLPYPPIQVQCRNQDYAALLAFDYCGSVSELSAITQYINNEVSFAVTQPGGKQTLWTPEYLVLSRDARRMLCADVEAERDAIAQYRAHIRNINDEFVNAVLRRIIRDEEYHIMLLQGLLGEL